MRLGSHLDIMETKNGTNKKLESVKLIVGPVSRPIMWHSTFVNRAYTSRLMVHTSGSLHHLHGSGYLPGDGIGAEPTVVKLLWEL